MTAVLWRLDARGRYTLVGLTCAGVHNAILIGLSLVGIHYAIASVVSFIVVDTLGYLMHSAITYQTTRARGAFARYTLAMAANYPLLIGLLFLMVTVAHMPVVVAAPAGTILLFVWNFISSRWAIVLAGSHRHR